MFVIICVFFVIVLFALCVCDLFCLLFVVVTTTMTAMTMISVMTAKTVMTVRVAEALKRRKGARVKEGTVENRLSGDERGNRGQPLRAQAQGTGKTRVGRRKREPWKTAWRTSKRGNHGKAAARRRQREPWKNARPHAFLVFCA